MKVGQRLTIPVVSVAMETPCDISEFVTESLVSDKSMIGKKYC